MSDFKIIRFSILHLIYIWLGTSPYSRSYPNPLHHEDIISWRTTHCIKMSPEVLQIEDNEILYGAINQQHTTKITKCRTLKTAKIQYYRLPWLISIMSKTLYLGNMTTLGHVMHFWCRLFPMSTDGQAWRWRTKRSWCKLQSISPPNDSLQGLQPAVTRAERSGREKSVLGVCAPLHPVLCTPGRQLITGDFPRALSPHYPWHPACDQDQPPGLTSVTMCRHCAGWE